MPEGDTVWLAAKRLDAALGGHELLKTDFRVPTLATIDLAGQRVESIRARGKHLLTRFSGGLTLHTHFRMEGSWHLYPRGRTWTGGPLWQVRAVLETAAWDAVGYRLPVVELLPTTVESDVVGHLGPDLLGPDWDEQVAVGRLRGQPDREIGMALLDQRNLAGLGNLYRNEVCFLGGVSPWLPAGQVPDLTKLVRVGRRLLLANRDRPAQTTTGSLRPGEMHWVFERAGRPCRRCSNRVAVAEQGEPPRQRLSYWCPACQPGPRR